MTLLLANTKKKEAQRTRAAWIASLSAGVVSATDLVQSAHDESLAPLRRLRLDRILNAQPGWGPARTKRVLAHLRELLDVPSDTRLTVAWLIDARADGRRLQAFADAIKTRVTPWNGFPFAPDPKGGEGH